MNGFCSSSVGQTLSSLASAACKHLAAVSVGHSLAETVFLGAVTFLGLIGSEHQKNLLSNRRRTLDSKCCGEYIYSGVRMLLIQAFNLKMAVSF